MSKKFMIVVCKSTGKQLIINPNAIESIHEDYSGETDTVYIETKKASYDVREGMDFFKEFLT